MRTHSISAALGAAILAGSLAACAGGDGEGGPGGAGGTGGDGGGGVEAPACGEAFTPCGGDPVGTWHVETCGSFQARFDLSSTDPSCGDLVLGVHEEKAEGTLAFAPGGTGHAEIDVAEIYTFLAPAECVAILGEGAPTQQTCTAVATAFVQNQGFSGGHCTADASGACDCELLREYLDRRDFEWTVEGTTISYVGATIPYAFCVDGDVLVRHSLPGGNIEVADLSQVLTRVP